MRLIPIFVAGVLLLGANPAWGYVPYRTEKGTGKPFFWRDTCVSLVVYPNNFAELPPEQVEAAAIASTQAWGPASRACAYLDVQITMAGGAAPHAGYDAHNALIFRTDSWPHDSSALALTSLTAKTDGHIVDVDIEFNAVMDQILWMNADVGVQPGKHDFQNTLTHELGHFIGFSHTCRQQSRPDEPAIDDQGAPLVDCAGASDEVRATTMFPDTQPGDVLKRTLEPEDIRGVCETYPVSLDPRRCQLGLPPDTCGCSTPPGSPRWATGLLGLALAVAATRSRRRR